MTRQKYFCGQPTPEGPCDRLAVRRGRCHHHGGGPPRCLHSTPDGPCQKFRAYGGTVLACVEHGGGKRCVFPDCKTSAQKGEFCVTHTNCKTCQAEGCSNFIQSSSVMCREHSWMCHHPGCKVSRASSSFCTRHGGGRRCRVENCKEFRLYGDYCIAHGGGRKCLKCSTAAESGRLYCRKHDESRRGYGSRECATPECKKLAQGNTDFCRLCAGGYKCERCGEPRRIDAYRGLCQTCSPYKIRKCRRDCTSTACSVMENPPRACYKGFSNEDLCWGCFTAQYPDDASPGWARRRSS